MFQKSFDLALLYAKMVQYKIRIKLLMKFQRNWLGKGVYVRLADLNCETGKIFRDISLLYFNL